MFTKAQLELLEEVLDTGSTDGIPHEKVKELKGAIHSALWAMARSIPKKDKEAIERAKAAGIVQVVGRNTSGLPEPKPAPSRLKPQALEAKSGDELLSVLGL